MISSATLDSVILDVTVSLVTWGGKSQICQYFCFFLPFPNLQLSQTRPCMSTCSPPSLCSDKKAVDNTQHERCPIPRPGDADDASDGEKDSVKPRFLSSAASP